MWQRTTGEHKQQQFCKLQLFCGGNSASLGLFGSFIANSPPLRRGKRGSRRGRRPSVELLQRHSPGQILIDTFIRVSSDVKGPLAMEVSDELDVACVPRPVKRASVALSVQSEESESRGISSVSEPSLVADLQAGSLDVSSLRLSPSFVTSEFGNRRSSGAFDRFLISLWRQLKNVNFQPLVLQWRNHFCKKRCQNRYLECDKSAIELLVSFLRLGSFFFRSVFKAAVVQFSRPNSCLSVICLFLIPLLSRTRHSCNRLCVFL